MTNAVAQKVETNTKSPKLATLTNNFNYLIQDSIERIPS